MLLAKFYTGDDKVNPWAFFNLDEIAYIRRGCWLPFVGARSRVILKSGKEFTLSHYETSCVLGLLESNHFKNK